GSRGETGEDSRSQILLSGATRAATAATAAALRDAKAKERALHSGLRHHEVLVRLRVVTRLADTLFRLRAGVFGPSYVDILGGLCEVRENGDMVVPDFHETATHRKRLLIGA